MFQYSFKLLLLDESNNRQLIIMLQLQHYS